MTALRTGQAKALLISSFGDPRERVIICIYIAAEPCGTRIVVGAAPLHLARSDGH